MSNLENQPSFLFTSESVGRGHPDKVCDQMSDAVVDFVLSRDSLARVACETMAAPNRLVFAGEIGTSDSIFAELRAELPSIVRQTLDKIGYTNPAYGFHPDDVEITDLLNVQSSEIRNQVMRDDEKVGAGDQGLMFGYATSATSDGLPVPISLSHALLRRLEKGVDQGLIEGIGPDTKSQVTARYVGRQAKSIDTVVLAVQHVAELDLKTIRKRLFDQVVSPVLSSRGYETDCRVLINHAGTFVKGGPAADSGLTGRKIIVDTYGGFAPHGGGAFSGKDPTKVDRSAAYAARWVALHLVRSGLAQEATVQLSYAIGSTQPVSILVDAHGTQQGSGNLTNIVAETFDLSPKGILENLNLRRPIYGSSARGGHFGRTQFPWEQIDENIIERLKALK